MRWQNVVHHFTMVPDMLFKCEVNAHLLGEIGLIWETFLPMLLGVPVGIDST